jgi:hypothetical protein
MDPEDVSTILEGDFGIAMLGGLHYVPLVHQDLGTSLRVGCTSILVLSIALKR